MNGPDVMAGHYRLIGPNGSVITSQDWEKTVRPNWQITMQMVLPSAGVSSTSNNMDVAGFRSEQSGSESRTDSTVRDRSSHADDKSGNGTAGGMSSNMTLTGEITAETGPPDAGTRTSTKLQTLGDARSDLPDKTQLSTSSSYRASARYALKPVIAHDSSADSNDKSSLYSNKTSSLWSDNYSGSSATTRSIDSHNVTGYEHKGPESDSFDCTSSQVCYLQCR